MGGQLVDRVVITIAPVFLQGYNVLASKTDDSCDASSVGAGETGCYCYRVGPMRGEIYCRDAYCMQCYIPGIPYMQAR